MRIAGYATGWMDCMAARHIEKEKVSACILPLMKAIVAFRARFLKSFEYGAEEAEEAEAEGAKAKVAEANSPFHT